ncbi:cache domain-containing protein [Sulfurimonas sp.]|uniref:cache domain-containing protein n=1 Tax=Sulfurimonas sp. TaxID=2022749 RepID=UPI003D135B5F
MLQSKILNKTAIIFSILITLLSILIYNLTLLGLEQPSKNLESNQAILKKIATLVDDFNLSQPISLEEKKEQLTSLTQPTWEIIQKKYELSKPENIDQVLVQRAKLFQHRLEKLYTKNKNQLSKKQLKEKIVNYIRTHRYGKESDGYYFVYDFNSRLVLHPIKPSIEGISLKKVKDADGVYYINEMVQVAKEDGSGTVKYRWKNPSSNEVETKYAYVFKFKPYNWVIGTGEYASQLNEELKDDVFETIKTLPHDTTNFFVIDYNSTVLSHPLIETGSDFSNIQDSHIASMIQQAKTAKEGTYQDIWEKPKLSFVKDFPTWSVVIGADIDFQDTKKNDAITNQKFISQLKSLTSGLTQEDVTPKTSSNEVTTSTLLIVILIVFIFTLLAIFLLKKLLDPIVSLSKQASLLTTGDYNAQSTYYSNDEIGHLCHEFNIIVSILKKNISQSTQKVENDKVETLQDNKIPLKEQLGSLKGSSILLVEDNQINQGIVSELLKESGIVLEIANNGKEAFEMFVKNSSFELILMDIQMPIMDGYEATKAIRKTDKDIPIIALSADTKPQDIQKTKDVGMNDYLNKPIEVERLYKIILQYVSKKSTISLSQNNSTDDLFELPSFNSIDTQEGLRHLAGNKSIYLKLLNNFKNDFKDIDLHLLNDEDLKIFSHTLKGLSGNIGATNLHLVTQKLDETLDKNLFEEFYKELNIVIDELNEKLELQEDDSTRKEPITVQIKEELFANLKEAIELMEPKKCRLIIEQIATYQLSNKDYKTFIKVQNLIEAYEFDEALEIL